MIRKAKATLLLCFLLTLSACVTRDQADEKLARGCAAGAELFLDEGYKIEKVKDKAFKTAKLGKSYREVILTAVESDGWSSVDKEYRCIFVESFGFANSTHSATIYQIKVNGQTYGKEGDQILGDFNTHLKLTETVEQGMHYVP